MTTFDWIFYTSYLIVGLYVHDVRWRMWNKRDMRMFLPDRLASLLAWPFWIWYCDFFNHIMFMPVDAQKHILPGECISNFKIGRCIHCDSLLLEYDRDQQHHLLPIEENRFKEIFGFDHNMIFKG